MARLTDKVIVVTGGSRGIGAGIARTCANEGAHVILTYASRPESAERVRAELPQPNSHLALQMNIADPESVTHGFSQILEKYGRIDGLVNNAGITQDQLILRMKDEDFMNVLQTNLMGTFYCTKLATKVMIKQRQGSIVNISSVIAEMGNPGQTNYAASKGGVEAFSRSLAKEVASRKIRVNCIAPGFITTEMTSALSEDQKKAITDAIPLGDLGTAEDVAHAVTFLLSEESRYITGQVLHVNGGLYM